MPHTLTAPTSRLETFQCMTGTFDDWTLSDVQWYFERLGWTFTVDGDRQLVTVNDNDWLRTN